ncbi:hypothetical protein HY11_04050 [Hyphomonas pacifica]|nr:hypothetical protein HY11_04050 [Hyphomonas pacifica]
MTGEATHILGQDCGTIYRVEMRQLDGPAEPQSTNRLKLFILGQTA